MNEEYRMNEGRNAAYKYIVIDKKTNEVITSGYVTGGNKTDCSNMVWNYFDQFRREHNLPYKPHFTANDEIRIHLHATDCGAGIKLWEKRVAKAYGQQELADIAGIDIKTLQDFESGRKNINKAAAITIKKMANALGCQMEDLITVEERETVEYRLTAVKAIAKSAGDPDSEIQEAILVHALKDPFKDSDCILFGYDIWEFDTDEEITDALQANTPSTFFTIREDGIYIA